jgi:CRISPR system Cascade subunit CasC
MAPLPTTKADKATLAKWVTEINQQWEELVRQKPAAGTKSLPKIAAQLKQASRNSVALDIALFGRMLADKSPDKINVDAACQVAHAISTHRITMEMDYFTAVDDLKPDDETGAGHINFTEFNSACFYRYACLDTRQLLLNVKNLDNRRELALRAIEAFLRASFDAVPSGKKTWSAHYVRPSFVWSLVNAFERAVPLNQSSGLVEPSIRQLDDLWGVLSRVYGENGIVSKAGLLLTMPMELPNLGKALKDTREEWFAEINQVVAAHLEEN